MLFSMRGIPKAMRMISGRRGFMLADECWLKANVVVEQMKGTSCFLASSLPQKQTESLMIRFGFSRAISAVILSSSASVVSVTISISAAKSFPAILSMFSGVGGMYGSMQTYCAPAASILSRNSSVS